jgi:hypothetical protein
LTCAVCKAEIIGEPALEVRALADDDIELLKLACCDKDACIKRFVADLSAFLSPED